jgi:hypothetical protein
MAIKKIIEIDVEQVKAMGGLDALQQSLQETETKSASLKAELRKLKEQLAQLPEGSAEYNKIAKQAGEVSDKIGDINTRIKNLGSDTKNIDAVVQGTQALSGAFTVATSASALLGDENKELQETMLKVESAIGLTVGIQSIANALQKESALAIGISTIATKIQIGAQLLYTAVVGGTTGALKALRIALVSTGVGALVVALGFLVEKLLSSSKSTESYEDVQKRLNATISEQNRILDLNVKAIDNKSKLDILRAKIAGKSETEILELEKKAYKKREELYINDTKIKFQAYEDAKNNATLKAEDIKKAEDAYLSANQKWNNAIQDGLEFNLSKTLEYNEKINDARDKAGEKAKQKTEADAKKAEEDEKARLDKLNSLYENYLKGNQDLNAVSEQQKLDLQKQRDQEEINALAKTNEEKAKLTTVLNEKYVILQKDLDKKLADEKLKKDQEKIEKDDAEFLRLQELNLSKQEYETLLLTQKYEKEYLSAEGNAVLQKALQDQLAKDVTAIDEKALKDKQILKEQELAIVGQTFGKIAELAGKNSKIGKAFAVGQALMNTYQGITAELQTKAVTPYEIGLKVANVAFVAATGFKAVKQILATNPMSSGGGSASSGGGASGGGASATPQFNLVGQSSTNQLTSTIAGQQNRPVQTYVVGSQVSTQQALDRNAVANSVFG